MVLMAAEFFSGARLLVALPCYRCLSVLWEVSVREATCSPQKGVCCFGPGVRDTSQPINKYVQYYKHIFLYSNEVFLFCMLSP